MTDEPNRIRSFVEDWVRRTLTISGCAFIWLLLLATFPLLLYVLKRELLLDPGAHR